MHDPMSVALEIRRPWPERCGAILKKPEKRWHWQRYPRLVKEDGTKVMGPWWRPRYWSPFVTLAGREFFFPSILTVWHVDPERFGDDDSCINANRLQRSAVPKWEDEAGKQDWELASSYRHRYRVMREVPWWDRMVPWRYHVWHWQIQVPLFQNLKRWLFTRCRHCSGRFSWRECRRGEVMGYSWNGSGPAWFRSAENVGHMRCDGDRLKESAA